LALAIATHATVSPKQCQEPNPRTPRHKDALVTIDWTKQNSSRQQRFVFVATERKRIQKESFHHKPYICLSLPQFLRPLLMNLNQVPPPQCDPPASGCSTSGRSGGGDWMDEPASS